MIKVNVTVTKDGKESTIEKEFKTRAYANAWIMDVSRDDTYYDKLVVNFIESTGAQALNRIFG